MELTIGLDATQVNFTILLVELESGGDDFGGKGKRKR